MFSQPDGVLPETWGTASAGIIFKSLPADNEKGMPMNKTYCEVTLEGSFDLIKGFVLGFLEGKGIEGEAIFEAEHHMENESRFGQLLRFIEGRGNRTSLIVGRGLHDLLRKAIDNRNLTDEIKIVSMRDIREAYFEFSYRAYSRKLGEELKTLFGSLPPGLRIEKGHGPKETVNREGKGVEVYAPLHEYEIEAKGEIHGPVKEVITLYGEAEHKDMVELGTIKLR